MSSESLANRIVRLLSANAHGMLDSLEGLNPEAMMNQFIRDLDEAIAEVATELGRDEAAKHLATASIARQNNEIEALAERIELAVKQGNDTAASAGIARQLDLEDTIAALHRSLDEASQKAIEHERTLLGLRAKRREMEAAVQAFLTAQAERAAEGARSAGPAAAAAARGKAEKAEAGFNRIMARTTGVAGTVTGSGADPAQLKALETMQRNHRIAERLARIKAGGAASGD
ncbi:MAG: PspA/IM30 family protein [Reyranella sp.]|uniref:PspA/IM30 family protein n=1 Tax=Reyranella sp. TaxID=1929291 RepID=UPI001ACC1D7E|nr:PspA/IM30 family protein [Reyranella sp.]MBN9090258.1 PspA/IM30 family protein [Reyranella sp.]